MQILRIVCSSWLRQVVMIVWQVLFALQLLCTMLELIYLCRKIHYNAQPFITRLSSSSFNSTDITSGSRVLVSENTAQLSFLFQNTTDYVYVKPLSGVG